MSETKRLASSYVLTREQKTRCHYDVVSELKKRLLEEVGRLLIQGLSKSGKPCVVQMGTKKTVRNQRQLDEFTAYEAWATIEELET